MKWFRFYSEALEDPKVQRLPVSLRWHWVEILCLANRGKPRGRLPVAISDIAFSLRVPERKADSIMDELIAHGLIDEIDGRLVPHNWDERQPESDNVAARVRRHREREGNELVTLHETPSPRTSNDPEKKRTEQKRTEQRRPEAEGLLLPLNEHYQNEIGLLTPMVEDELREWAGKIPDERFIEYAFKEASSSGARNWKYVASIFARLEAEGWPADPGATEGERDYGDRDWYQERYDRGKAQIAEPERGSLG